MTKSIGYVVVCVLGLVACSYERYEDCDEQDRDHAAGSGAKAGGGSATHAGAAGSATGGIETGGASGASGGSSAPGGSGGSTTPGGSGGSAAGNVSGGSSDVSDSAGAGGGEPTPNDTCAEERDCPRGFNCDLDAQRCVATDAETCPELESEAACSNRRDCEAIYAGIGCSCGQDCVCQGGEPGCICESFEYFACKAPD